MRKRIFAFVALLLAVCMPMAFLTALAEGETVVFSDDFEQAKPGSSMPAGWSFHSYEDEYNSRPGVSFAELTQADDSSGRGSVLHMVSTDDDDAAVYRSIEVEPNSTYRLSCYIKTSGITGSTGEGAGANVALRGIIARSQGVYDDSDWRLVELVGVTDNSQTQLVVSCRIGGYSAVSHGEAWFDDFKVEKLTSYAGETVNFFDVSAGSDSSNEGGSAGHVTTTVIIVLAALLICAVALIVFLGGRRGSGEKTARSIAKDLMEHEDSALERIKGGSVFDLDRRTLPAPTDNKLHFKKLDWIFVTVLTVVYAAVALFRLGSLKFPTSAWQGQTGESIRIEFESPQTISKVMQNCGVSYSDYTLTADNGEVISLGEKEVTNYWNMFKWKSLTIPSGITATTGLTLTVNSGDTGRPKEPDLVLNELVIYNTAGDLVKCTVNGDVSSPLFDEQDTVPEHYSYMTSMYFDEVYHARTAYEHINNLSVYEWTHPPLGKLIIAVGILIFGMKPFGWRIMGTLFGIFMVPIMYCFAKRLVKRPQLCLLASTLFAFDFMHFTQTRIATVDVYALFFTLLMTYYMYQFITCDIGDSLKRMLKPLALSGLFFGLGCASKWTCIYTGAALALLFFAKLIAMGVSSRRLKESDPAYADFAKKYLRRAVTLCLWCVIFFIVVPAMIYGAAYCRYYTAQWKPAEQARVLAADSSRGATADEVRLTFAEASKAYVKGVIKNQSDMYNYHSGLQSDHSASSPWWMWIFNLRPTWFYVGQALPNGNIGTISSFGNPAVWNICFIGTVALIATLIFHRRRLTREAYFLFICMASALLPWVFVTRSTYAYHYFSTVPYIILASVYLLKYIEDINEYNLSLEGAKRTFIRKLIPNIKYIWIVLTIVLFALFYPVISGLEVPREYIYMLQWVPYKKRIIYNDDGTVKRTLRMGWTFLGYGD